MDVTPLIRKDQQVIQSYAGGRFRVSGQVYEVAVIVTPGETLRWDKAAQSVKELTEDDFAQMIERAEEIDVVLLGCGASMTFLDPKLKKALSEKGLSVDIMDTGAACRTYNVLMAEGRRVVAALFPV
ncbi:MAG: Mth938-like domain-containing protein [Alphaproteobacteria bacterium]|nr:Mth938-like domain-containing protein [Alphaproteobacteria bacterium]